MGLLSIFKRKTDTPSGAATARPSPAGVQQARTRARQRLVGAGVLVAIGVIVFPLLFESQPRPIAVDIPIEIPRKDGAPTLVMPTARPAVESAAAPARTVVEPVKPEASAAEQSAAASAATSSQTTPAAPVAPPVPAAVVEPAPKPVAVKPVVPEPVQVPKKASAPTTAPPPAAAAAPAAAEAAKAKALLEGKPVAAKETGRFVVQVGAFAEAAAAQDTRAKLDKLGLKSFTQVTETAAGSRTRVRLGPFATREEAERVLARTKAAGVDGVVLTL